MFISERKFKQAYDSVLNRSILCGKVVGIETGENMDSPNVNQNFHFFCHGSPDISLSRALFGNDILLMISLPVAKENFNVDHLPH